MAKAGSAKSPRTPPRPGRSSIDVLLLLAMLIVALVSGSLALLGGTLCSALIMITRAWVSVALTRAATDAGQRYQFGTGKLEQAGNAAIGLVLAIAGLWLATLALALIVAGRGEAPPFGLALAATANAVYMVRAATLAWARSTPKPGMERLHHGSPASGGVSGLVPLLIVQATLTVAALARDPPVALAADCSGAILVALLMTATGVRMLWEAVLDLIDHPLRGGGERAIAQLLLEQGIHAQELVSLRSRRSGRDVFVEFALDPVEASSFEETRERLARACRGLEDHLGGLDVAIRLDAPRG
jgi:divalent metal cation (Fe/Co/Zn/Cd) transporter